MKHDKHHGKFTRFERSFCVDCLWEITDDVPVTEMNKLDLEYLMHRKFWAEGSPHQVYVDKSVDDREFHHQRVRDAELRYPIILVIYADRTIDILDGLHRLTKSLYMTDFTTIKVRRCDPLVFKRIREQMLGGLKLC